MIAGQFRRYSALVAVVVLTGCSRFHQTANAPEPPPPGPTDGNIAALLLAANNTDVSYARLAQGRSLSPAIQEFARRMLVDHGAINTAMKELISRTNIQPEEDAESLRYRDESTARRDMLRELTGPRFDSAYIANEIDYHGRLLSTLDNTLIPRTRDAQLRQVLVSVRPAVAAHLTHAQKVQQELR